MSLLSKNLPKILTAKTRSPDSDWMSMIDKTVSYKIAFPTFLDVSVFVATWQFEKKVKPHGMYGSDEYYDHFNTN